MAELGESAVSRLRAVLPEALRLCARQHRSAIWDTLVAAEDLLAELDGAGPQSSPESLATLNNVRRYAEELRVRPAASVSALTIAAALRGLVGEGA